MARKQGKPLVFPAKYQHATPETLEDKTVSVTLNTGAIISGRLKAIPLQEGELEHIRSMVVDGVFQTMFTSLFDSDSGLWTHVPMGNVDSVVFFESGGEL